eukprot:4289726-Alexandrium_andersonii.AAC.1
MPDNSTCPKALVAWHEMQLHVQHIVGSHHDTVIGAKHGRVSNKGWNWNLKVSELVQQRASRCPRP